MNIIFYYPKNEEDIKILRQKVASVHAESVLRYIQKIQCPKTQQLKLYNEIKKAYRDKR